MELRSPTAYELLAIWEQSLGWQPFQRALAILSAASPGSSVDELARLSIGQRDARLILLHARLFGSTFVSLATCPGCDERLELAFDMDKILTTGLNGAPQLETDTAYTLNLEGFQISFRLPNSLDLLEISGIQDVQAARNNLLNRCFLEVSYNGEAQTVDHLPAAVLEAVEDRMNQLDPHANISLTLICPTCGLEWEVSLNIVPYFLEEIDAWVPRLLREVHTLASAYGWREAEILALSPWRREFYLDMVRG